VKAAPLAAIPRELVAAADYERFAREHLDDNAWEYLCGGAGDEITLRENRAAFERVRLEARVLADVRGGHTRLKLFGQEYEHPVFLAPVAYQKLFHPEGELATAMAAAAMQAGFAVSTLASVSLEAIAAATPAPLWFQLYLQASREHSLQLLRRAEASGYKAVLVTVDAPLAGIRNREQRAGFALPPGVAAVNVAEYAAPQNAPAATGSMVFDVLMQNAPTWQDMEWLVSVSRLPVVIKGIVNAADACRALELGVQGIVVSNHGGRILDTVPASIEVLPAVAGAVAGRVPVLLDSGVRRGSDICKALALGADAVMIGRPYIHALATAGALGVAHLLRTLREELEITMALCGCRTLEAINRDCLFRGAPPR
jgi:4-hydroxymandelate oxidase